MFHVAPNPNKYWAPSVGTIKHFLRKDIEAGYPFEYDQAYFPYIPQPDAPPTRDITRSVKRRVSSGPAAWLTPEPLELTDPPSSSLSGPVPGRTATVGYLELIVSQRPPTQIRKSS